MVIATPGTFFSELRWQIPVITTQLICEGQSGSLFRSLQHLCRRLLRYNTNPDNMEPSNATSHAMHIDRAPQSRLAVSDLISRSLLSLTRF
jgi:hypothetical protein